MSAQPVRPTLVKWLYTNNPFYAISAVLMLFGVRSAYGDLQIGEINCWLMMGTLAAYTSLLAGIGVLIVRWGKVWEDARSILVLLLLLFLAVSISADDLFVTMESATGGVMLLVCGYLFSACVTESVLWFARIRLGLGFLITCCWSCFMSRRGGARRNCIPETRSIWSGRSPRFRWSLLS